MGAAELGRRGRPSPLESCDMLRDEEARLRRILGRVVLVSTAVPAAIAIACGSSGPGVADDLDASAADASVDGTIGDAATEKVDFEGGGSCDPQHVYLDATTADGAVECADFWNYPCGLPPGTEATRAADCYFPINDCQALCPGLVFNCHAFGDSCLDGSLPESGPLVVDCVPCPGGVGRRPHGLVASRSSRKRSPRRSRRILGDYLARAAHLEAASVHAFRQLARDLAAHGAPQDLLVGAARAARDEARHARVTSELARIRGGRPAPAVVRPCPPRALGAVALENAVEGCVRETFGAAVATWQGLHATDPAIARAMRRIAIDEARHAALAWAVARWARPVLGPDARTRIAAAITREIRVLEREAQHEPHADLVAAAGLPRVADQRRMLRVLARDLWAAPGVTT